jgi:hypothetical protein
MKIISYSLFNSNKKFNNIRYWDDHKTTNYRYWINLPAVILVNNLLYPNYKTKLFIDNTIKNSILYTFLQYLSSDDTFNFILHEIADNVSENEPSCRKKMWRYIPIWDKENSIVFPRDLDSLPNTSELKCCRLFQISNCEIMTIRSHLHHTHTNPALRMLGGLSGFKPNIINYPSDYKSFYEESKKLTQWGLDQDAIRIYFLEKQTNNYLKNKFMDCAINYRTENSNWPCIPISENDLNKITLSESESNILKITDPLTDWAGKPIDSRNILNSIIELSENIGIKIKTYLKTNLQLGKIYNV